MAPGSSLPCRCLLRSTQRGQPRGRVWSRCLPWTSRAHAEKRIAERAGAGEGHRGPTALATPRKDPASMPRPSRPLPAAVGDPGASTTTRSRHECCLAPTSAAPAGAPAPGCGCHGVNAAHGGPCYPGPQCRTLSASLPGRTGAPGLSPGQAGPLVRDPWVGTSGHQAPGYRTAFDREASSLLPRHHPGKLLPPRHARRASSPSAGSLSHQGARADL